MSKSRATTQPTVKTRPAAEEAIVPVASLADEAETFAHNLALAVEAAGKAVSAYLRPREEGKLPFDFSGEIGEMIEAFAAIGQYWTADPERALQAQSRLWTGYRQLWDNAMQRMLGQAAPPIAEPAPGDRRFKDPEWSTNQFFDFVKQLYLITGRWAEQLTAEAEGLDPHTRHKARFYMGQLAAALSPSNFIATNPELIRDTFASRGENLVRGMNMLAEDIAAGGGNLKIRQTDPSQFELGRNLATTPGKVIFENQICQIIQYAPATETVLKRPLLIVPPWINKYYILDLTPEKSFVAWAVAQGHTVFLISWVNPGPAEAKKTFADYMKEGIITALDVIGEATGEKEVNAIGYCVGGTLLATTLAWLAVHGDRRVRSATFFAAQTDFTHAGDIRVFIDERQIAALERQMEATGYLEGDRMATAFNLLRANDLIWPYIIGNYFQGREPPPFDILYWNSDSARLPAANHSFYLRNFYLKNRLADRSLMIDDTKIDLKKVRIPIYMLSPREDHISPPKSVFLGASLFGGKITFVLAGSGHIAGVINPPSRGKYPYWTAPYGKDTDPNDLDRWIERAEEHPGSWWPHWHQWIEARDKRRVPAREVGGGKLQPMEDAPGRYVRAKAVSGAAKK